MKLKKEQKKHGYVWEFPHINLYQYLFLSADRNA